MKVCLLNDSFPPVIDGVANVVMNYARIMQTENLAEVLVGTPYYPGADYDSYPYKVIPYQSFDTTKIVKGYRTGNPFDWHELHEMAKFQPDIIHTHCPFVSTMTARMLEHKTDAPVILTYHTKFDVDIARAVQAKFIQEEAIKALVSNVQTCDEVWVVSQGAGENLRSLGYEGEYLVMNNGVDFAKGRVSWDKVIEATRDYPLGENLPVFLYVGRIIKYKGLPLILDALKMLQEKGMDFRMVFVGSGPDEGELKETAQSLGIAGKCIFTGPIYDREILRAWNTRADLFLFPSTYDTNGIVVREAAACGLASVLIKDSCAAEGITDDRNGFLIEETAESMAELLLRVGQDLAHVHDVGQHAMDEIYISWDESVRAAHRRYEEVLENKKAGMYLSKTERFELQLKEYTDDFMDQTMELFNMPKRFFEGMIENVEHMESEIKQNTKAYAHAVKEDIKHFVEEIDEWKDKGKKG